MHENAWPVIYHISSIVHIRNYTIDIQTYISLMSTELYLVAGIYLSQCSAVLKQRGGVKVLLKAEEQGRERRDLSQWEGGGNTLP